MLNEKQGRHPDHARQVVLPVSSSHLVGGDSGIRLFLAEIHKRNRLSHHRLSGGTRLDAKYGVRTFTIIKLMY